MQANKIYVVSLEKFFLLYLKKPAYIMKCICKCVYIYNSKFKGQTDNTLKQELVALQADKFTYENTAKVSHSTFYFIEINEMQNELNTNNMKCMKLR